jgi:hypothetical protein
VRRKEAIKAKNMLKKIKIDTIYEILTKYCWKYGMQYDILYKSVELMIIKLCGRREVVLISFSKADIVHMKEFEQFIMKINMYKGNKGIYITTGIFEESIEKSYKQFDMELVDGFHFIKSQIGIASNAEEVFKYNKFKFYRYLPA